MTKSHIRESAVRVLLILVFGTLFMYLLQKCHAEKPSVVNQRMISSTLEEVTYSDHSVEVVDKASGLVVGSYDYVNSTYVGGLEPEDGSGQMSPVLIEVHSGDRLGFISGVTGELVGDADYQFIDTDADDMVAMFADNDGRMGLYDLSTGEKRMIKLEYDRSLSYSYFRGVIIVDGEWGYSGAYTADGDTIIPFQKCTIAIDLDPADPSRPLITKDNRPCPANLSNFR